MAKKSAGEELFAFQLRAVGLDGFVREWRFHPTRKWRFDFAFPAAKLAIEVEGGAFSRGRHTRGEGFTDDCEKYSEAAALGWRVIRATTAHVNSGQAIRWVGDAL